MALPQRHAPMPKREVGRRDSSGPLLRVGSAISILELLSMKDFNARGFAIFMRSLHSFEWQSHNLAQSSGESTLTDTDAEALVPVLGGCDDFLGFFYLPATANRKLRLEQVIAARAGYAQVQLQLQILRETLEDELKDSIVFYMPPARSVYHFAGERLLGAAVVAKFPRLASDIDEAGKGMAAGRFTAAIFHLMRVMEGGVQEFAARVGVSFTDAKTWQSILNEAKTALNGLSETAARTVQLQRSLSLLYAVKIAGATMLCIPRPRTPRRRLSGS